MATRADEMGPTVEHRGRAREQGGEMGGRLGAPAGFAGPPPRAEPVPAPICNEG